MEEKYEIVQFHCHWGHDESCGSEHTVDGEAFPAEVSEQNINLSFHLNTGHVIQEDQSNYYSLHIPSRVKFAK